MFIVSPKWVYLSNKKIESNKSLLIDRSIIADILVDNKIDKTYGKLPRIPPTRYCNTKRIKHFKKTHKKTIKNCYG